MTSNSIIVGPTAYKKTPSTIVPVAMPPATNTEQKLPLTIVWAALTKFVLDNPESRIALTCRGEGRLFR
jgi:hypothetical protein